MAQVVSNPDLDEWFRGQDMAKRIDSFLAYLIRSWSGIPELAAEWPEWDEHSRLSFVMDWPVCEDRLHMLRMWAEQGKMTPAQCARYEELLKLVAEYRPTLVRLLEE